MVPDDDPDRRVLSDRRNESIAASLVRLEEYARQNRDNIASIRTVTEDGFRTLNGRVRTLEEWRVEQTAYTHERVREIERLRVHHEADMREIRRQRAEDVVEAKSRSASRRDLVFAVGTIVFALVGAVLAAHGIHIR